MEDKALLEVKNLTVEFRTLEGTVHAVDGLNYELKPGGTLGIVGESGSGKSVSSLQVMQLVAPEPGNKVTGEILYQGKDLLKCSEKEMQKIRGNDISMIFQEPMTSLNPIVTCGKQIAEALRLHKGLKKKEAMAEAIEMMHAVGIANPEQRAKQYPHQMSGGMRQRIMIAMALACRPQILIADEPTTALDVTIQAQILDLMRELNQEYHTAIIMITHDLGVVSELCENIVVMYTGQIMEEATTEQLFSKPLHPYTRGLIKAIPKIQTEREKLPIIPGMVPNPTEKITGCSFCPRCDCAMDICSKEKPPMVTLGDRKVKCWQYAEKGGK
ncbi:MAG: ABC transporter ATP-binding protein [Lachnospiraceae bacterium]|nr:ABC transporter ATP-binding protein [Lachnospiraceae bacterium]